MTMDPTQASKEDQPTNTTSLLSKPQPQPRQTGFVSTICRRGPVCSNLTSSLAFDLLSLFISTFFTALYIWTTYLENDNQVSFIGTCELFCASYFLLFHILRNLFFGELWNLRFFITLASIGPVFFTHIFWSVDSPLLWQDPTYWRLLLPLRFIQVYVNVIQVIHRMTASMNPITQQVMKSYVLILTFVLCAAGTIQVAETAADNSEDNADWTFFSSLFNSILVFATIGSPPADTTLARVSFSD